MSLRFRYSALDKSIVLAASLSLTACCNLSPSMCKAQEPPAGGGFVTKNSACEVDINDWMEETTGYDAKQAAELAATLKAAAEADAKNVSKVPASASADFSTSLNNTVNQALQNHKSYKVSQEFFQRTQAYRQAVCSLERELKTGILTTQDAKDSAQKGLVNLSIQFGGIQQQEDAKLRIQSATTIFNLFEGQYEYVVATLGTLQPGKYVLDDNFTVGHCVMKKGSSIEFKPDGTAVYSLYVTTMQTSNRDVWHQWWILPDGQRFGKFDSMDLHTNDPFHQWTGSFRYTAPPPNGRITWSSGC